MSVLYTSASKIALEHCSAAEELLSSHCCIYLAVLCLLEKA